jgi:endonuclease/exonuclease/phosphatase family metal-dependent hydrolase
MEAAAPVVSLKQQYAGRMTRQVGIVVALITATILVLPATAQISVTPSSHAFTPQQIGTSSSAQEFVVRNTSNEPLTLDPSQVSIRANDAPSTSLSVLTLNIWFDQGDWSARLALILDGIREFDPDIIGLQEVIQRANLDNQAKQIADSLGYYYYFDSVDPADRAQRFGNAILSRYPIEATNFRALNPLNQYRKVVHARIDVEGHTVDVYNTHLHNAQFDNHIREEQIAHMLEFVDETNSGGLIIVTGDYNANPDWPEMSLMYEGFTDVYPLFHANHLGPEHGTLNHHLGHQRRRIDYVFFSRTSEQLVPVSAEVVLDEPDDNNVYPSDHFGVFAAFNIVSDDADFLLDNIEEPIELGSDETTSVRVTFAPQMVGSKEVTLSIADVDVGLSGVAFDATVTSFPWSEDFGGLGNGELPSGWSRNAVNWSAFNSNFAGGEAPELVFWWQPVSTDTFHVRTPPIQTTGLDSLHLSFRHRVQNFGDPGIYDLRVISIVGEEEHVITEWMDPGDVPAEMIDIVLNQAHGVGADRLFLAWEFRGRSDNITRWTIDDVVLSALPSLSVSPASHAFGMQQVNQPSDPQVFSISNAGGGLLELGPEDIRLSGADAEHFVLTGIADSLTLAHGEVAEVTVSFVPQALGDRIAELHVLAQVIVLSGSGFDSAITELPWTEDFTGLTGGEIPLGWTSDGVNWGVFGASNAGGQMPEMVFWWQPELTGRFYLTTPHIVTTEEDSLVLTFRHRVRNFGDPGKYTLQVLAIADGTEHVIQEWVDPGTIAASLVTNTLGREHGVGAESFKLAWVFDGITNNISQWDIDDIRLDYVTGTSAESSDLPLTFALNQNYPNPFNPTTTIQFSLPSFTDHVSLAVFDMLGRKVAELVNSSMNAGSHAVRFDGSSLANGVYVYRLDAGGQTSVRTMVLLK